MNFAFLIFFLLFQVIVNYVCGILIPQNSIAGIVAYYLVTSLIIAFVWGLLSTPREYRKEFYKQPGFHKNTLTFFTILIVIDLIFFGINLYA